MSLILKQFEKEHNEGKFSRDTAQEEAVESLSLLQDRVTLKHNRKINHFLKGLLNKAHSRVPMESIFGYLVEAKPTLWTYFSKHYL